MVILYCASRARGACETLRPPELSTRGTIPIYDRDTRRRRDRIPTTDPMMLFRIRTKRISDGGGCLRGLSRSSEGYNYWGKSEFGVYSRVVMFTVITRMHNTKKKIFIYLCHFMVMIFTVRDIVVVVNCSNRRWVALS